jgi:hypothetical protein
MAQSVEGVEGEWWGVNTANLGGLWMQNSQKMRCEAFVHNDDMNVSTWLYKGHKKW